MMRLHLLAVIDEPRWAVAFFPPGGGAALFVRKIKDKHKYATSLEKHENDPQWLVNVDLVDGGLCPDPLRYTSHRKHQLGYYRRGDN